MKEIPLTQGKVALVEDGDYEKVNQFKWYTFRGRNISYAVRHTWIGTKRIVINMHRFIIGSRIGDKIEVDHIDGNGLNNQRKNLRLCTRSQNRANSQSRFGTSQYKGVYWNKISKKWRSSIQTKEKNFHLGYFDNEESAALAYDKAATKYYGEFAKLNFGGRTPDNLIDIGKHMQIDGAVVQVVDENNNVVWPL